MKTVLLSYLDRKKVVRLLPSESEESDIVRLMTEFKSAFSFEKQVSIYITFQRFEKEWDDYVDLDKDCVIADKDRLKVVVMPILNTPPASSVCVIVPSPKDTVEVSSVEEDNLPFISSRKRQRTYSSGDESDTSARPASTPSSNPSASSSLTSTTPSRKKMKIIKSADDAIPLPDPFPLPKHFRADVEVALKTEIMSSESRKSFISANASAMLACKRYPTRDDYNNVAHTVCSKYKFLKSPAGAPNGAVQYALMNRFKEFRRKKKPRNLAKEERKETKEFGCTAKPRSPGFAVLLSSPLPPVGEDSVSFQRHVKALQAEFKKPRPNQQIVNELVELSFVMRRSDILDNLYDLPTIFEKYPFLRLENELLQELQRISGNPVLIESGWKKWQNITDKIAAQASIEAEHSDRLSDVLSSVSTCHVDGTILSLSLLPLLLPGSKCRADPDKIVYFTRGATAVTDIVSGKKQPEPYILVVGEMEQVQQVFLVTDNDIVTEIELSNVPLCLLAAYFVFNIQYPKGCKNVYTFLEVFFMGSPMENISASVKHFLATLV